MGLLKIAHLADLQQLLQMELQLINYISFLEAFQNISVKNLILTSITVTYKTTFQKLMAWMAIMKYVKNAILDITMTFSNAKIVKFLCVINAF